MLAGRSNTDVAIACYTSTGALDSTFSGDGLVTHDFGGGGGGSSANDVAVLPDGRILVAGVAGEDNDVDVVLARFNTNGTLDTTYGTGGRVVTVGAPIVAAGKLVLQGTKAIISGFTNSGQAWRGTTPTGRSTRPSVRVGRRHWGWALPRRSKR